MCPPRSGAPGPGCPGRTRRAARVTRPPRRAPPRARAPRSRSPAHRGRARKPPAATTASNAVREPGDLVVDQVHRDRDAAALGDQRTRSPAAPAVPRPRTRGSRARCPSPRVPSSVPDEVDVERDERLPGADRRGAGRPDRVRAEVGQPLAAGDGLAQALVLAAADLGERRAVRQQRGAVVEVDGQVELSREVGREPDAPARPRPPSRRRAPA